jgi:hypothetical protein
MQHCPPEILVRIVDNMRDWWSNLDYRTVQNTALLCRSMRPIAQAVLFKHVCLHPNRECAERYVAIAHDNSSLPLYIHHLEIIHGQQGEDISQWLSYPVGLQEDLFASFSNITKLSLFGVELSKIETEAQISYIFLNFTSLQSLTVDRCRFFNVVHVYTLLSCLRSLLRHLDISQLFFTSPEHSVGSNFRSEFYENISLDLSSLEMRGNITYFSTWLLHSGTSKGIHYLDIQPQREDIRALSDISGSFEALTSLQLDMFGPRYSQEEILWGGKLFITCYTKPMPNRNMKIDRSSILQPYII